MSQARLATELGIGTRTVTGYERGKPEAPVIYSWALVGVFRPLRSKVRTEHRRQAWNLEKRRRTRRERRRREAARALRQKEAIERRNRVQQLRILGRVLKRGGSATVIELRRLSALRASTNR